jgi:hypothetical protein
MLCAPQAGGTAPWILLNRLLRRYCEARANGFTPSFKVELTKEEKIDIELPSSPRWELDLVAYKGAINEILVVECKSYLDSRGVVSSAFLDGAKLSERFKLFTRDKIRDVVLARLGRQLQERGLCPPSPGITLCLAAGNIASDKDGRNRAALERLFAERGWRLFDEKWLFGELERLAESGYENDVGMMVAKLYARRSGAARPAVNT